MSEPQAATGKYIYCLISCEEPREFTSPGLDERGTLVHTVHSTDLAAVVSDSPVREWERSRQHMMAHTAVLEEVMQEFTVLPVRFGTVAPSAETLQEQVLQRRYDELTGLLAKMGGRVELGLKAFWLEAAIFQEIVADSPPIRKLRDKLQGRSVEETYFDRARLGEMVEASLEQKRDEYADLLLARLRPLAGEYKLNQLLIDRMVLNGAFLVDQDRQAEFDEAVRQLDEQLGDRLKFKYVGPVPPYNFVSIVIQWDS